MIELLRFVGTVVLSGIAFYAMGKHVGYKDGLRDGVEIEREAWEDGGGPDDDGDGLPLDRPLTLAEIRAMPRVVRGTKGAA